MIQEDHDRFALPNGYRLNEYCIRQVLGQGGFGITYLAHDERLDRDVAIKEFMPSDLAVRQAGSTVMPRSTAVRQDYKGGLERFLKEARTLARFSHPNIVRVLSLIEANGTAYIVMCYEAGESLGDRLKARGGPLPAAELLRIADPLLDGLAAVHKAGFLHRDIKPSNIFLRADGDPVLLDFGTARQLIGSRSRSIVSILTPGYAPIEQYHADGDQGAWTDIYGMGAVLYSCISGHVPPDAPARAQASMDRQPDPMPAARLVGQGRYPEPILAAIDRALAVLPKDRLRSVEELRQALIVSRPQVTEGLGLTRHWPILTAGGGAALLAAAALLLLFRAPQPTPAPAPSPTPPSQVTSRAAMPTPAPVPAPASGEAATLQDEATLSNAREAIQVSTVYGRQMNRRLRQQDAVPSLERLAQMNTRYQKQLDDVLQGLESLDRETASLLRQYAALVDKLAQHPERFERIKPALAALDLPEAGKVARQHLIEHVTARESGAADLAGWQTSLDRSYASRDLW